jgi:hypothetical protein
MAGTGTDTQSGTYRRVRHAALAGALALLGALAIQATGATVAPDAAQAQVTCPAQPTGLAPNGSPASRFTMLIRINTQQNVNAYTNPNEAEGGLGGRIRSNDIFVLNTRFEGSGGAPAMTPTVAADLADDLRAVFPCNRIIALNGMSFDPSASGYAFTLYDHPAVYAVMTDFEPMDWNAGIPSAPGRPPWDQRFSVAFPRIKAFDGLLAGTLASTSASFGKRTGLVPINDSTWNYGSIAQDLDKKNRRLGNPHLGPQSVQIQDSCADSGAGGFAARAQQLFDQYRFKFIRKKVKRRKGGKIIKKKITVRRKLKKKARPNRNNLSLQISFSDTPNPSAGMAITKTSPSTAALCTFAGLNQGGGAIFFFASHEAMRVLFQQTSVATLRPPTS